MFKPLRIKQLTAGRGALACALSLSLSTFACTTERTVGQRTNGSVIPHTMTSSSSPGSGNASSRFDAARPSRYAAPAPLHADDAAAIMAAHQQVKLLGPAAPGPATRQGTTRLPDNTAAAAAAGMAPPVGGYTINQTPFSHHVSGVEGGASDVSIAGGMTSSSVVTGAVPSVTAASVALPTTTALSSGISVGAFAAGRGTNPGASSVSAFSRAVPSPSGSTAPMTAALSNGSPGRLASRVSSTATPSASAGVANPVRLVNRSGGGVMITNVTAGSGR